MFRMRERKLAGLRAGKIWDSDSSSDSFAADIPLHSFLIKFHRVHYLVAADKLVSSGFLQS